MHRPGPYRPNFRPLPRAGRRHKRADSIGWRAQQPWLTAVLFVVGSTFFFIGSISRLPLSVSNNRATFRSLVLAPYLTGSLCYTLGCILPVGIAINNLRSSKYRRDAARGSEKEVAKAEAQVAWSKLDVGSALLAVTGGLLINFACLTDLRLGSKAELVFTAAEEVLWRVTAPTIAGRALFMTAGYLTWAARNKSWSLSVRDGTLHFWWASLLFFVGTGMFYVGWFFTTSPFTLELVVDNWFWIVVGHVTGSCCLFAASYIMLLEVSQAPASVIAETTPLLD